MTNKAKLQSACRADAPITAPSHHGLSTAFSSPPILRHLLRQGDGGQEGFASQADSIRELPAQSTFSAASWKIMTCLVLVLSMWSGGWAADKPLKIYIMSGQSNMQGHAKPHTLAAMALHPQSKALHDKLVGEDGTPRVHKEVSVAALSDVAKNGPLSIGYGAGLGENETKLGPELAFGVTLHEHLKEPILIIKASWGGRSLNTHFRPPSAGPFFEFPDQVKDYMGNRGLVTAKQQIEQKLKDTGSSYQMMMSHIKTVLADPGKYSPAYDPKAGYEIAGFVWFQGYNDMIAGDYYKANTPDAYKEYSRLLSLFIKDVRKDMEAPKMPFVIGVLGINGVTDGPFQNAQAAPADLPEFKGNVIAVRTGVYWDQRLAKMEKGKGDIDLEVRKKWIESGKKLSKDEQNQLKDKLLKEMFTEEDLKYWDASVSNAAYHYLGSARIYSQIGEAFAKALLP